MKKELIITFLILFNIIGYSQSFEKVSNVDLKGGYLGFASWCDFNSDGYLDVFVTGVDFGERFSHAMLYKNNGNKTFTETNITNMPRVIYGNLSWGDYDNNGTLDLIYAGTKSGFSEDNYTGIYKNQGDSCFIELSHSVPKLGQCYLEWVDVNNDGLLDIYYQGINSFQEFDLGIYKNNGNDSFEKVNINIEKISGPRGNFTKNSAKWADFDNDGYKDIIVATSSNDEFKFECYKNLGDFSFQKVDIELPQLNYVNLSVGDLNNDGLQDLVFSGSSQSTLSSSDTYADIYIFINHGNFSFSKDSKINNVGVFNNTLELGDFNNDGFKDILFSGAGSSNQDLKIYTNNHDNTFSLFSHSIPDSNNGGATFGDFDNDNDLDILYYGRIYGTTGNEATYVYENKSEIQNELPTPPDNITVWAIENDILITWSEGNDDSTNPNCLNYNLQIGMDNDFDLLMSSYSLNGKLKYPSIGNVNLNKEFKYCNLNSGEYSVMVQAIDNSYNASLFSDTIKFCFKESNNLLGDTITICKNDSVRLWCEGDYLDYSWNTGSADSEIFAKEEGLYNVNLTHQDGCISSEIVCIKTLDIPSVNLGNDIDICQGDSVLLHVPPYSEIVWSNNSNIDSVYINQSGTYWVTVINSDGCSNRDSISINVNPIPNINLGNDTTITSKDTLVLYANNDIINNLSFIWNDNSLNDSIIIYGNKLDVGEYQYWLKVTNEFGCSNSDTIFINLLNVTQISSYKDSNIKVFPIPFNEELIIDFKDEVSGNYKIEIYNIYGESIIRQNSNFVDNIKIQTNKLTHGIYFLIIRNKFNKTIKAIKIKK